MQPDKKRFLVIGRVGDASLHKTWIADKTCERNWDLQLNAYGKDEARIQDGDLPPVIDRGTKWDSLARHLKSQPELLEDYDYIMFPDDDVEMEATDINTIFEVTEQHDLTIAQPSLNYRSHVTHDILLHCPGMKLRYTNYIEAMSVCIKTPYLKTLLPLFEQYCTGWGIDMMWGLLMLDPIYQAAIIDSVTMTHTRPLLTGPLYQSYPSGIVPHEEYRFILNSFQNMPAARLVYGAITTNGHVLNSVQAQIWGGICLLMQAVKSRKPFRTIHRGLRAFRNAFRYARYQPAPLQAKPKALIATYLPDPYVATGRLSGNKAAFDPDVAESNRGLNGMIKETPTS